MILGFMSMGNWGIEICVDDINLKRIEKSFHVWNFYPNWKSMSNRK